jgi:hypothetical protein
VREKKGNRRHTTLSLLNADAKALCLRPDPELVKVFGIPRRRRSVESCPSAAAKAAPKSRYPRRRAPIASASKTLGIPSKNQSGRLW